jgi:hypothetical protein
MILPGGGYFNLQNTRILPGGGYFNLQKTRILPGGEHVGLQTINDLTCWSADYEGFQLEVDDLTWR